VCLSVCLWPLQCEITFDPIVRLCSNFQHQLNSLQVIFKRVTWTPGPTGSGPDPEKAGFHQIYLLRGFWGRGVVSHLFGIGTTRQIKCWERNFDFWPTARENRAGRRGWPGGQQKFWNFNIFYKRDPCLNRAPIIFCFLQLFDPTHPEGPTGTLRPRGVSGGVKIKRDAAALLALVAEGNTLQKWVVHFASIAQKDWSSLNEKEFFVAVVVVGSVAPQAQVVGEV